MTDWMMWLALAGVLVIVELFTGTFYILMIAIGATAGVVAALGGAGGSTQIVIAAIVGVLATVVMRRSRLGAPKRQSAERDPDVNIDIGQRVIVGIWHNGRARVQYRGAPWDVELAPGGREESGEFRVVEVSGNRLIVNNARD